MVSGQAPPVRIQFAARLKELREQRGFKTARSLARSLDIDENRYTRYERAEVEPDLSLLLRICQTLDVSADDLLGRESDYLVGGNKSALNTSGPPDVAMGLSEPPSFSEPQRDAYAASLHDRRQLARGSAWRLARIFAEVQEGVAAGELTADNEFAVIRRALHLLADIERDPYAFARRIVEDPIVSGLASERRAELVRLVADLMDAGVSP